MTILLSLMIVLLSYGAMLAALWTYDQWKAQQAQKIAPPPPPPAHIAQTVLTVCAEVGLPREQVTREYDLARAGKLADVLLLSARALQKDHELTTVGDVIDWLAEAPSV